MISSSSSPKATKTSVVPKKKTKRVTRASVVPKKKTKGVTRVYVPDEVIHYNILAQLAPKSVLKFKSVYKSWYNVTNSTSFINAHHNYTLNKSPESTDLLIVSYLFSNKRSLFYTYLDAPRFVCGTFDEVINIKDIHDSVITQIVGLGNGLVCLKLVEDVSEAYMLCNPVTRDFSGLIKIRQYSLDGCLQIYGFGYDYLSDDYKIVSIKFRYHKSESEEKKCFVEVVYYSTSRKSWKQYRQSNHLYQTFEHKGEVVNNKIHWIAGRANYDNERSRKYNILTFDLHTEKLGDITFSTQLQQLFQECHVYLMVSTYGRLFVVATPLFRSPNTTEIWAYGEAESWTLCYKVNIRKSNYETSKVITYRSTREDGDEVLLLITNYLSGTRQLGWYNIENKSFRKFDGNKYFAYSWVCKPTLAPIPVTNLT